MRCRYLDKRVEIQHRKGGRPAPSEHTKNFAELESSSEMAEAESWSASSTSVPTSVFRAVEGSRRGAVDSRQRPAFIATWAIPASPTSSPFTSPRVPPDSADCGLDLRDSLHFTTRCQRSDVTFGTLLGAGQHGRAYGGEYRGQHVALKVRRARKTEFTATVPEDGVYFDDDEAAAAERMLVVEAEILSRIPKHPHIVGFVGIVLDDNPGGPILILQLASRHSVADVFVGAQRARHSWVSFSAVVRLRLAPSYLSPVFLSLVACRLKSCASA